MHLRVTQTLGSQNTEQFPTIHRKPFIRHILQRLRDFFFFPTGISYSFFSPESQLWFTIPDLISSLIPPSSIRFLSPSLWEENKQFISLDIHAFRVSPFVPSSLSRYFLGQRQFPSLRGILKLATKKIHYSLCDINKYEVSTCMFKPIYMCIWTAWFLHDNPHREPGKSSLFIYCVSLKVDPFLDSHPQDLIMMQTLFWLRLKAVHPPPHPNLWAKTHSVEVPWG